MKGKWSRTVPGGYHIYERRWVEFAWEISPKWDFSRWTPATPLSKRLIP